MKRVLLIICLLFISLFAFTGCNTKRSINKMCEHFFEALDENDNCGKVQVISLEAAKYDNIYYYYIMYTGEVKDSNTGEWLWSSYIYYYLYTLDKDGNLIDIVQARDIESDLLHQNEEFKDYYNAISNGKYVQYTNTEIDEFVEKYYK